MPNLIQRADGSMGIEGSDYGEGACAWASFSWDPNGADASFFIAPRKMRIVSCVACVEVAGTDASAVTGAVKKAASATDIAAGTAIHSGTIDLKGTVDTNQTLTLSATSADLDVAAGTRLGLDLTGVMTAARGVVTVGMRWA